MLATVGQEGVNRGSRFRAPACSPRERAGTERPYLGRKGWVGVRELAQGLRRQRLPCSCSASRAGMGCVWDSLPGFGRAQSLHFLPGDGMGAGSWRWSRPGLPARRGCQLKPLPFPRGGAGPALRPCAKKWALLEGAAWPLAPGTYGLLWYCMGQQPPGGARAAGWGQGMDGPGGSAELGVLPPGSAPQLIEVGTAPERHRDFPRVAQAGQAVIPGPSTPPCWASWASQTLLV